MCLACIIVVATIIGESHNTRENLLEWIVPREIKNSVRLALCRPSRVRKSEVRVNSDSMAITIKVIPCSSTQCVGVASICLLRQEWISCASTSFHNLRLAALLLLLGKRIEAFTRIVVLNIPPVIPYTKPS